MSLFVKLKTGFWTHRKTARLRAAIGDDAFWVPPRLWCYAAENQPDGDFSGYSAQELAMLVGYSKDATSMLEALHKAGFMHEGRIHGWEEHNGFHQTFSERAKNAASARWEKHREKSAKKTPPSERGEEMRGDDTSNALSMLVAFEEFWKAFPKRIGKGTARASFARHKCSQILPQILTAIRFAKASQDWTKEGGKFIPYPTTWLNREGWLDDPSTWSGVNGSSSHPANDPNNNPW